MTIESANGNEEAHASEDTGVEDRTVFVRNLPYSFTEFQLQEVFSEIGPVRRSFIIKQKGSDQHRGFGYVQFAVAEDALRAVKEKDGVVLQGRKVMVKVARRRPSFEARRTKRQTDSLEPEGKKKRNKINDASDLNQHNLTEKGLKKERSSPKQRTARTVILGGLVSSEMRESAIEHAKKVGPVESIQSSFSPQELKGRDPSEPEGKKKRNKINDAPDLNQHNLTEKGLKKERSSQKQRTARTVILGGLVSPEMRESAIEHAKKVGPVESIQSSLSPQELKGRGLEKDGCKGGAAAIVFKSVKVASQCVAELHQKSIGNGSVWARQLGGEGAKHRKWRVIIRNLPFNITEKKIQELFASSGFVWEAKVPRKESGQARGFAFASFITKASAEKGIHDVNGKIVHNRIIAVDWAVERRVFQASASLDLDIHKVSQSDLEDDDTASESEEDVKEEQTFFKDLEDECAESGLLASSGEVDLAKKVLNKVVSTSSITKLQNAEPKPSDLDDGCCVPHELKTFQSEIKEKEDDNQDIHSTSQANFKRTIFVKNLPFDVDEASVKKLFLTFGKVISTYLVRHPTTKRPKGTAFLQFRDAESVEAACAAASGSNVNKDFVAGIFHGGRKLDVLQAVDKTIAASLEKEKMERRMVDRRNLYLLSEGKIQDGSPAANGVSEKDMQKRRELGQVKLVKLRSPTFHVSKTRLAVHNLPKSLNELGLRKLFIDAVKLRATKQEPVVVQAKIVRDKAKGKTSRGFAFVEFTEHEHALVALRVLNNNPETFGPERRPIVEFAIDNVQLLRKRQEQLSARGKPQANDSRGNSELTKRQDGESKPNVRQIVSKEKRKPLQTEQAGVVTKGLTGPGTSVNKSAWKKKPKPNLQEVANSTDSRGNSELTKRQDGESKPNLRQIVSKEKRKPLQTEQAGVVTKELTGPGTSVNKSAWKKKPKPNLQEVANSNLKRKWEDLDSKEGVANAKMHKLSTGKAKRKGWQDSKNKPLSGNNNSGSRVHPNGLEQKVRKAASPVKNSNPNPNLSTDRIAKKPQLAKKKKWTKPELEDKLEKLVAKYREKYFGDQEQKKSTGVTASTEFKRWFE